MKKIIFFLLYINFAFFIVSQKNDTLKFYHKWSDNTKNVIKSSILSVPQDFREIGSEFTKNWKKTAIITAGIGTLVAFDKPITRFYQDEVETRIKYSFPKITPKIMTANGKNLWFFNKSDTYFVYSLGGLYVGSLFTNYKTGQRACINSMKAVGYSILISQLTLKPLFGRQRPDLTLSNGIPPTFPFSSNPYDFFNFHWPLLKPDPYGTGMPSFHATAYVAVAQVMAMEFNNYWIPYSLVGLIFFSDIKSHRHWVSDMVAGGFIGGLIGTAVVKGTRKYEEKQRNKAMGLNQAKIDFKLIPNVSRNFTGLHLLGTF